MRAYLPGCVLLVLTSQSAASVLTKENEPLLCRPGAGGGRVVDPDRLAQAIAAKAGADLLLDGANSTGQRDGSIQLRSTTTQVSEPTYAMVNVDRPFGPNVDPSTDDAAKTARDQIVDELSGLFDLMEGKIVDGPVEYRLERRSAFGTVVPADAKNPRLLFGPAAPYAIGCYTTATEIAGQPAASPPAEAPHRPSWKTRIVLRGAVDDLSVAPGDLKDATPASLQYDRDKEADTRSFKINGIVGLRLRDPSGTVDYIPYLSYEHTGASDSDNDIEKISPGFLLAYRWETPAAALHTKVETSVIFDRLQHSRQGKLRVYVDPAIALGRGHGVLFGSYLKPIGPLWLRPDLTLIVDATKVFRAGDSEELAKADSYFGFGGELSLRSRLEVGRPISDILFKAGVRNLWLTGDIDRNHVRRWFGSAEYAPKDFPYVGFAFQFTSGPNDDTFQQERKYGVGVTLRY